MRSSAISPSAPVFATACARGDTLGALSVGGSRHSLLLTRDDARSTLLAMGPYSDSPVIEDEPAFEDMDHDVTCECEYCRPDEWPPSWDGLQS